jgi:hypothetical protein
MSVKMGGIEKMWRCRGRNDGGMETCSLLTNLMLVMIRLFSPCDGRLFALHSDRLSLYKYLNARHWIYDRTVHHNTHDKMADPTELEILYCMIGAMEICLLRTDILQQLDYVYVALHGAAHNETTSNNITALVAGLPILIRSGFSSRNGLLSLFEVAKASFRRILALTKGLEASSRATWTFPRSFTCHKSRRSLSRFST